MKKYSWITLFILSISLIANITYAKGSSSSSSSSSGRSSSSFSSSSKSSSSFSSSSKPSTPSYTSSSSKPTGITSSNSSNTPSSTIPKTPIIYSNTTKSTTISSGSNNTIKPNNPPKLNYIQNANTPTKKTEDVKSYRTEKARYTFNTSTPPVTTRSTIPTSNRSWSSYDEYKSNQRRYYTEHNWNPPVYIYNTYPSFGGFSNPWLFFMLGNMSSNFFYHRQDDPGVKTFLAEAERLSTDNKELKDQLAKVKADMEKLKQDGTTIEKEYFPKDQDPDIATELEIDDDDESSDFGTILVSILIIGMFIWIGVVAIRILRRHKQKRDW